MANLTLQKISPEDYEALANEGNLDNRTIYWLTDGRIYNNGIQFGGNAGDADIEWKPL